MNTTEETRIKVQLTRVLPPTLENLRFLTKEKLRQSQYNPVWIEEQDNGFVSLWGAVSVDVFHPDTRHEYFKRHEVM